MDIEKKVDDYLMREIEHLRAELEKCKRFNAEWISQSAKERTEALVLLTTALAEGLLMGAEICDERAKRSYLSVERSLAAALRAKADEISK